MKSGRIVERRDQVLIGFLSREAAAASTFFSKWASQNGPFFTERAIAYSLSLVTALDDHCRRALVATRAVALGRRTPRAHRIATRSSLAFTTTVRVIHRVHRHASHRRPDAAPTIRTGLADLAQAMLFVTDFTDRCTALDVYPANFAGAQTNLSVRALASQQHRRCAGGTRDLCALARQHFHAVDRQIGRASCRERV